jgi:O-acetyl-ADP-ribose deacetylase (regulator of RNase III)/transcriptional regulator with XRE-family HTH domain
MAFRIIRNDITKVMADAIVNTANPDVVIGDGVDSAIYEAAGAERLLKARRKIGYLDIGEVGITPAFGLKAKYIIHSSGPYWIDGKHDEEILLRKCYDKALMIAYKHKCKSIAFPLMSTGTYGFPKELGLQIALESFNEFLLKYEMEIILVVFGETAYKISGKIFDDVQAFVDDSYVKNKLQHEYRHDRFIPEENTEYTEKEWEVVENKRCAPSMSSVCMDDVDFLMEDDALDDDFFEEDHDYEEMEPYPIKTDPTLHKLDYYMQQELGTFGTYLQQLIHKKGMKNSEVYTAANLTKQYFSKLLNGKVTPSKTKILSLAVALHLNMDETIDFLRMSGYAFSPFSQVDKIFEYFIRNKMYDIYRIDIVLFDYGLPTLVND